ncbi:hypothetical protein F5Y00DRAFT_274215 [Daldinia vernicosa]|uniref:uncharacterized protein n=1 Tax=Daldinia vernicosa TaxID=114800 RepID=UPI0020086653|nr:uncharacterized protein F5Y00DRAFT_274215 [Daldinia vernicosa]KAI0851942.1 hypothetical protein F5Y00DRAFT_274215 [Daldinia vernicosa]
MSTPGSYSTGSLDHSFDRCQPYSRFAARSQCAGTLFHRDSFELYRERTIRRAQRINEGGWEFDEEEEGEENNKKASLLGRLIARIRQAWSALPCSTASRNRQKNEARNSNTEEPHNIPHVITALLGDEVFHENIPYIEVEDDSDDEDTEDGSPDTIDSPSGQDPSGSLQGNTPSNFQSPLPFDFSHSGVAEFTHTHPHQNYHHSSPMTDFTPCSVEYSDRSEQLTSLANSLPSPNEQCAGAGAGNLSTIVR